MNEDDDYVYTELNPLLLDQMLDKNSFLMNKYDRMIAWHKAQEKWRHDLFVKAEANAVMRDTGPATKAKFVAANDPLVSMARTMWSIATAQLGLCERRVHALDKEAMNLGMRSKLLQQTYNR